MSTLNVDIINPESGTPGDFTPVNLNGSKIKGTGIGLRSIAIGDDLRPFNSSPGSFSADAIHLGISVFPNPTDFCPQTVAIGTLIGDLAASSNTSQSIWGIINWIKRS